jgi:hypothetical protein
VSAPERQGRIVIESELEQEAPTGKIPSRKDHGTRTSRWFRMGDTMVLPQTADEEDTYFEEEDVNLRTRHLAWKIALIVLALAALTLTGVIMAS